MDITQALGNLSTEEKLALLKGLQKEKKELNQSLKADKQEIADLMWEAAGGRLQEYFDGPIGALSYNAVVKHPETGKEQKVQFLIKPVVKKQAADSNGSDETATEPATEE